MTLLTWPASAIVHDIKGENWEITAGLRARVGRVLLFDPTNPNSAAYNISDGKQVANGNPNLKQLIGQDQRTIMDSIGKVTGLEAYEAAAQKPEGQITETSGYMFPRPGSDPKPLPKVSFVTRAGDLGCSVGYYK